MPHFAFTWTSVFSNNNNNNLAELTHEVEVPRALGGNHKESKETIRQQHLHFLVVRREVTPGIVPSVLVVPTPVVTRGGQFVGRQGTRTRSETERRTM